MVSFPPCKINLGLSVLSKRADGYHNLETCFYPVPWMDVLEVISTDTFEFTSSGNFIPGASSENLCVKAYTLLKKDFDIRPVKIHLHKIIPSGAGLGGGSSDAAYTLRLLNELFDLKLSPSVLMAYAARLGSDCAFFVQDYAMLGTGRGEMLREISLSLNGKYLVIVKPDVHVSTADAFAGITPREHRDSIEYLVTHQSVNQWKFFLKNDFEDSVFVKYPVIKSLKEKLYSLGASYASMSGSGSAVYGIFEAAIDVRSEFEENSYWSGYL
jgi:4-diphosphocytidyl-2-C-methyl-D-erythritol kinase